MTTPTQTAKAQLRKLSPQGEELDKFDVQFNPESLKVTFTNQMQPPQQQTASDNSRGTSATQFVGKGATKFSVVLWFDVNAELPPGLVKTPDEGTDVRKLTNKVVDLIRVESATAQGDQPVPPAVRFVWGSFRFDGMIESIDQSLEYFSPQGVPLRASITLNMTQQSVEYLFEPVPADNRRAAPGAARMPSGLPAGTSPVTPAPAGATLPGMAASIGKAGNWQAIAEANGIENPRRLPIGQPIDMNVRTLRL